MAIFYFCLELIKTCPWGIQALFSKLFFCKQLSESTKKKWTDRQLLTSKLLSEISPSLFSVGRVKSIFIFGCYCLVKNTYFVFKIPNTTTPVFNYILWLLLFCIFFNANQPRSPHTKFYWCSTLYGMSYRQDKNLSPCIWQMHLDTVRLSYDHSITFKPPTCRWLKPDIFFPSLDSHSFL